jgi:hypothetical protein
MAAVSITTASQLSVMMMVVVVMMMVVVRAGAQHPCAIVPVIAVLHVPAAIVVMVVMVMVMVMVMRSHELRLYKPRFLGLRLSVGELETLNGVWDGRE